MASLIVYDSHYLQQQCCRSIPFQLVNDVIEVQSTFQGAEIIVDPLATVYFISSSCLCCNNWMEIIN